MADYTDNPDARPPHSSDHLERAALDTLLDLTHDTMHVPAETRFKAAEELLFHVGNRRRQEALATPQEDD